MNMAVKALKERHKTQSVSALAVALGMSRGAVTSLLAGAARDGTIALLEQRAQSLGWL